MSDRCSRNTMMYRGGQVNLTTEAVWLRDATRVFRLKDVRNLKAYARGDVFVLITPLDAPMPPVTAFDKGGDVPEYARRRVTGPDRVMGMEHLDKPIGVQEKEERRKYVDSVTTKLAKAAGVDAEKRKPIIEKFHHDMYDLGLKLGTEMLSTKVEEMISNGDVTDVHSAIRALSQLPTMADLAEAPPAFGQANRSSANPIADILDAMMPGPGQPVPAKIRLDVTDTSRVSVHALARWLERVEGVIDVPLVDMAKALITTTRGDAAGRRAVVAELKQECARRGLDSNRLHQSRVEMARLLSGADGKMPIVSQRPVTRKGTEEDRILVDVDYKGRTLELTLAVQAAGTDRTGAAVFVVNVVTVLDHSGLFSTNPFEDLSFAPEHREAWAIKTQNTLIREIAGQDL